MHSRLIWLEDCPFRCCLKHCCLMELSLSHLPKASMGQSHLCCLVLALDTVTTSSPSASLTLLLLRFLFLRIVYLIEPRSRSQRVEQMGLASSRLHHLMVFGNRIRASSFYITVNKKPSNFNNCKFESRRLTMEPKSAGHCLTFHEVQIVNRPIRHQEWPQQGGHAT
ncbi:hypothetical protein YC2023_104790 [Brassica napus]